MKLLTSVLIIFAGVIAISVATLETSHTNNEMKVLGYVLSVIGVVGWYVEYISGKEK